MGPGRGESAHRDRHYSVFLFFFFTFFFLASQQASRVSVLLLGAKALSVSAVQIFSEFCCLCLKWLERGRSDIFSGYFFSFVI